MEILGRPRPRSPQRASPRGGGFVQAVRTEDLFQETPAAETSTGQNACLHWIVIQPGSPETIAGHARRYLENTKMDIASCKGSEANGFWIKPKPVWTPSS